MFAKNRSSKKTSKNGILAIGGGLLVAFIAVFLALSPVPKARAATTTINVCAQDATNGWNLLSYEMTYLRAKLDNPANFGPGGAYGDFDFNYINMGSTVTEATLLSNACNIWFSGYEADSQYTPTELTELSNWVAHTNGQVFAGCDNSTHDPVCDLLGFTVTNDTDSYGFVVQQLINPITCDGALTPDDQLQMAGGAGAYFTGPGVTPTNVLAVHETSGVADPTKPIIAYTGAFFLTSDIDMVSIYTLTSGGGVSNNNDIMAVNAFSAFADVSVGNDICSSAGPQVADLTITKETNPAGGTDFPFMLEPSAFGFLAKWGSYGNGNGQFYNPTGMAVDGSGNVYVADTNNNRIQKLDSSGVWQATWGSYGSGDGQFNQPYGVAVDGSGNVYVTDYNNHRIQKLDSGGAWQATWGSLGSGDGQFQYPFGVAVDGSGNVYVADSTNHRIQKFGPTGAAVLDDDESHTFSNLAAGSTYTVTETVPGGWTLDDIDCGNATATRTGDAISVTLAAGVDVTCVFTNTQTPVGGTIEVRKSAAGGGNTQFEFDLSWVNTNLFLADGGSYVTAPPLAPGVYFITEVNLPTGWSQQSATCDNTATTPVETGDPVNLIVLDGDAWVCTFTNVYTPQVADLTITKATNPAGGADFPFVLDPNDIGFLAQWGSQGSGNSQFDSPVGVAVDGNGNVYVAEYYNHRIQKFDAGGAYVGQWGSNGSGNGQFGYPIGVAVDGSGNVYVADSGNNRIQKFAGDGTFLMAFGWDVVSGNVDTDFEICQPGDTCKDGSSGSGNGQFSNPQGVAVDGAGNVYVADTSNNRVQKFDAGGAYLTQWGSGGSGNGQFNYPTGVAVDGAGNVYVADTNNHRIQKFDAGGNYQSQWGVSGSGNSQFRYPQGVAADGAGNVYVADSDNNRIQKFDGNGNYLSQWGSNGSGNGQFLYPTGVAVDGAGNVYVADVFNNRIQKFGPVSVTLDDGQSHTFSDLPAGDHTVAELVPDGWTLDDIDCGSATATRDGDAISITLAAGDDVTCVFTNVQYGTITVIKQAGDVGDEFEFDPSWSNDNFLLGSGGAETSDPLPAGTYSVVEVNLPPGWSQQSATCDNAATTPVEMVSPASIPVADGDEWVCTFTNVYTPPPTNICVAPTSPLYTDILGAGMGSPTKHKTQVKLNIPNYASVDSLYGQLVAKNVGHANYVRFYMPGKNNYVQVNAITSPADISGGNFWYGADLTSQGSLNWVKGRWFLQGSGTKNHIPRAMVLYPTYESATNTYTNIWNTYDAAEGEVHWDTANGWTPTRVITESIAPPNGPTTFNVELALVDNDKDARPVWVTVEAGGVTQTQTPNNPSAGDQLNLMTFTLAVPAGTDEITITVYSPSVALDGVEGDSAMLVGMAANYMCAPLD